MDKKFLMGNCDCLMRASAKGDLTTIISSELHKNLVVAAIKKAYKFYSDFFNISTPNLDFNELAMEYMRDYSHAISLELFQPGGIDHKDYLSLWCLSHIYAPEIYIESGVFIGSSLHAFINAPGIQKILAIDPNLKKLKIPKNNIPGAEFIDDKDFSQIQIDLTGIKALAYFDDHIDSADRILQSFNKGLRYILFDDSTGFEGICQRLYPPIPTIPMIMNAEILSPGAELAWTFHRNSRHPLMDAIKSIVRKNRWGATKRVKLAITENLIEKCLIVKKLIKKYDVLPYLGEFVPQKYPGKMIDTSKYIVELVQKI